MPRKTNPDRPEYAKIITEARTAKRLSQVQLGQLIGRDAASIKKYEGGKVVPPFFVLMKITDVLTLDKRRLAELVLMTDSSGNWLDAAFEEISWILPLINVDFCIGNNSIEFYYDTRERSCEKLQFLFEIYRILQVAHEEYLHNVASETGQYVKNLFRYDWEQHNF